MQPLGNSGTHLLTSLSDANGLIIVPEDVTEATVDDEVTVAFLPVGYLVTVLIEAPILFVGLSRRHRRGERLFAGLWLTACTYPIVVIVMPTVMKNRPSSRSLNGSTSTSS